MTTYAAASDVLVRWGKSADSVDAEITALITTRLADVQRMIKRRIPDLAAKTADEDYLADLVQVEADSVLRLVRNPEGYISETDGNYTYMLAQRLATGKLEILPEEWETLGLIRSTMSILVPNLVIPT